MKLHEVLDALITYLSSSTFYFNKFEWRVVMGSIYFETLCRELKWCPEKEGTVHYYTGMQIKVDETNRTVISLEKRM